jgi:hypothetical protein
MLKVEYGVIYFTPARECDDCPRWTNVAIINTDFADSFSPKCPLHGYAYSSPDPSREPTLAEIEREQDSVRRFVVWMKGDQGRVSVVSPVGDPTAIPGYEREDEEWEDDAWHALYIAPDGEWEECHVIWSPPHLQFFLLEDGRYQERREI